MPHSFCEVPVFSFYPFPVFSTLDAVHCHFTYLVFHRQLFECKLSFRVIDSFLDVPYLRNIQFQPDRFIRLAGFVGDFFRTVLLMYSNFFECCPLEIAEMVVFLFMIEVNYILIFRGGFFAKKLRNFPVQVDGSVATLQVQV